MKPVTLLLTENVEGLGIVGDVVSVKPGFARNYLLPRGFGTTPTQGNIDRLAERRKQVEEEMARQRAEREALIEKLSEFEVSIERSSNDQGILFGGVSQHDIAEALREEGFKIDDRAVRVGEQIKRLDSYMIPIQLDADLKTEIKLWVVSDRPLDEIKDEEEEKEEQGHRDDRPEYPDAPDVLEA
jgi:large subunit ribosomal protein L9